MKIFILIATLFFQISLLKAEEELEKLPLIALLIKNGHLDRAQKVFDELTEKEKKQDLARTYTLEGLLALSGENYDLAINAFKQARIAGQKDPELSIYLAQAYYAKKDYPSVLEELAGQTQLFQARVRLYVLYCDSIWQLNEKQKAFDCLYQANQMHPEATIVDLNLIHYFNSLKLYQHSLEHALSERNIKRWSGQDLITIASLFKEQEQYNSALQVLELAHLLYENKPEAKEIKLQLARIYLNQQKPMAAATVLDKTNSNGTPIFPLELAEIYRQTGHYVRADYLLHFVPKREDQLKQKLTLYLTQQDYEKASALDASLSDVSAQLPDPLRYALAYALYKTRKFEEASFHLSRVNDQSIYDKAIKLRAHLRNCQENIWLCE